MEPSASTIQHENEEKYDAQQGETEAEGILYRSSSVYYAGYYYYEDLG
jgi:hypothetical protein